MGKVAGTFGGRVARVEVPRVFGWKGSGQLEVRLLVVMVGWLVVEAMGVASGREGKGKEGRGGGPGPLRPRRTGPQFLLVRAGALRSSGRGPQSYAVRRPGAQKVSDGRAPARRRREREEGQRRKKGKAKTRQGRAPQAATPRQHARTTSGGGGTPSRRAAPQAKRPPPGEEGKRKGEGRRSGRRAGARPASWFGGWWGRVWR